MMPKSPIDQVIPDGMLVRECTLPGETRSDGVVPSHANGIQLSRDRFLILYSTLGFQGRDDGRSGVYRLVTNDWTGPLIKEGFISQTRKSTGAASDGRVYTTQVGHLTAFGVPRGALVNGRRVAHENHFVVMWRECGRMTDARGHLCWPEPGQEAHGAQALEMQFRLNDQGDDIEIIRPAQPLRQQGMPDGQICRWPEVGELIKGYVPAVPMNAECSEWLDLNTASERDGIDPSLKPRSSVLPSQYRWDPSREVYNWVASGPLWGTDLFEGSIARNGSSFVFHARMLGFEGASYVERDEFTRVAAWCRPDNPILGPYRDVRPREQPNWHPTSVFALPDGSIARLGGAPQERYRRGRGPIYLVRIDPNNGFRAIEHVRLREVDEFPRIEVPGDPYLDFPKLLPHVGGREQLIAHRVYTSAMWRDPSQPYEVSPQALAANGCGLYFVRVRYREELPPAWIFEK